MRKQLIILVFSLFLFGCLSSSDTHSDNSASLTPDSETPPTEDSTQNGDADLPFLPVLPSTPTGFPENLQVDILAHNASRTLRILWEALPSKFSFTLCAKNDTYPDGCRPIKSGMGSEGITTVKLGSEIHFFQLLKNSLRLRFHTNGTTLVDEIELSVPKEQINALVQYLKANNAQRGDRFGSDVAINADGTILAVSAPFEDSASSDPHDINTIFNSGAVYLFRDTHLGWEQSAYLKYADPDIEDNFGTRIALSDDGKTLAVSMPNDDSGKTTFPEDPNNNNAENSGAVVIFTNEGGISNWRQRAILKSSNIRLYDQFGSGGLALSGDGNMLAVGSLGSTVVETFTKDVNENWSLFGTSSVTAVETTDKFGEEIDLNYDGSVMAIAASGNDSNNSHEGFSNNLLTNSGGVYIFRKTANGTHYSQEAFFKPQTPLANSFFGSSVSLSSDGSTLAVGSDIYTSTENTVFIFENIPQSGVWQQSYSIDTPELIKNFGINVELSKDGSSLAVFSLFAPNMPGVNADINDVRVDIYGHVSVFLLTNQQAILQYHLEATKPTILDNFGRRSAFSHDGKVLVLGASGDDTKTSNRTDDSPPVNSGAAWVYHL